MKIRNLFASVFAASLLFMTACKDDNNEAIVSKGAYEGGILVSVEGGFNKNQAEVSYITSDLASMSENIFAANNNKQVLGDVLQTIGFKDDKAYLVVNNSNKVEVVNRYSFQKLTTFQVEQPRAIAFNGNNTYITTNDFFGKYALNVFNAATNASVKTISFDRYAEKVVSVGNYVVVQTDGSTYEMTPPYGEIPSGHTITTVNAGTNAIEKTITLTDDGIIRDMISANGYAYVLSSGKTDSYIYEIDAATGSFKSSKLTGVANADNLRFAGGNLYFMDGSRGVYTKATASTAAPTKMFTYPATTDLYPYAFDVIDGKIYIADVNFNSSSKVMVYSMTGSLLKSFNMGNGVNGFYKN
ncbi:hypothetical protein [Soonwooa sp.]|uniref:hypothetical protein n=1 Tax=Soonwooa sp. TaxID=1938592 RepID=UPI0026163CC0|nr:hypothetical protein [Soonwooa sp.]